MNLHNDFINEWRNDAVMSDDLFDEARRIPILHAKWMEKYLRIQLIKKEKEYKHNQLYLKKHSFYMGREETAPDDRIIKTEVPLYIKGDEEVIKSQAVLDYYEKLENTLKEIINNINNRSFQIKNAIDWAKYTKGLDE